MGRYKSARLRTLVKSVIVSTALCLVSFDLGQKLNKERERDAR